MGKQGILFGLVVKTKAVLAFIYIARWDISEGLCTMRGWWLVFGRHYALMSLYVKTMKCWLLLWFCNFEFI